MLRNKGWLPRRPVCNCGGDSGEELGLDCGEVDGVFVDNFNRLVEFETVFGFAHNLDCWFTVDHNLGSLPDKVDMGAEGRRNDVEDGAEGDTSAEFECLLVGFFVAVKVKPSNTLGGGLDGEILVFVALGVRIFGNNR